jgi:hypothetical protein
MAHVSMHVPMIAFGYPNTISVCFPSNGFVVTVTAVQMTESSSKRILTQDIENPSKKKPSKRSTLDDSSTIGRR